MSFTWPWMLLLLVPALAVGAASWRSSPSATTLFPNIRAGFAAGGRVRLGVGARAAFRWRFWLAVLLAIVALARPQFGTAPQSAFAPAGEVVIALDLSRSMLAPDVQPSRLEHARTIATGLADALPEQKLGLIGFAGRAFLLAPPSEDRAMLQAYLPKLSPDDMVDPGTNIAALLETAGAAFDRTSRGHVLVLLSDGEADAAPWQAPLDALRTNKVRVIAVGIGTSEGSPVPGPGGSPLRDRKGNVVHSRLDAAILERIARVTGGDVLEGADVETLASHVRAALAQDARDGRDTSDGDGRADQFFWLLIAALLLLAWSAATEWASRLRVHRHAAAAAPAFAILAFLLTAISGQRPATAQSGRETPGQPGTVTAMLDPDLHGIEPDPLMLMNAAVSHLIVKKQITAADWLYFANTATRYGEVHRGHAHPLSEGVLRDGLLAVARGQRLDPKLADWDGLAARLNRLLQPSPPSRSKGSGKSDDTNEPTMANRQQIVPSEPPPHQAGGQDASSQPGGQDGKGKQPGTRNVGGNRRDRYDPAEWQDPSLVQPLYLLDKLRGTDSPAALFRLMQRGSAKPSADREQTW
ncbi:MAG: hypothetical protein JWN66_4024 [Sphingomonas bacterium]|uniref:VWA domain-containing protein n=1 Tax=Sphingomonas bacterium TaxID=1895847 RepID=UPI00262A23B7|nr:VWA domain-containing protein [Sphingomonas bacterium]MDB5706908.1 hypothetical protein [Sphingomonas bacterium]